MGAALSDAVESLRLGGRRARVDLIIASELFDIRWYLAQHDDVCRARVDPLLHYLLHGGGEGRDPNPLFDGDWYLQRNSDVHAAGINPLFHYLQNGAAEGRNPHPQFDTDWVPCDQSRRLNNRSQSTRSLYSIRNLSWLGT
jgi:hypothetical protein